MSLIINSINRDEQSEIPYVDGGVRAGFPSPAQDSVFESIDINKLIVRHPATTFCARVVGDSMEGANVFDGDILVIDRSLEPRNGDMAVCCIEGEFTLKYIEVESDGLWLRPANPSYPRIKVDEAEYFQIWGIVTFSIHKH